MFRRPDIAFKQVDTQRTINVKVFHNYEESTGSERKQFNAILGASGLGMQWGVDNWGTGLWGKKSVGVQIVNGSNLGFARSIQLLFTGPLSKDWGFDSIAIKYNNRKMTG